MRESLDCSVAIRNTINNDWTFCLMVLTTIRGFVNLKQVTIESLITQNWIDKNQTYLLSLMASAMLSSSKLCTLIQNEKKNGGRGWFFAVQCVAKPKNSREIEKPVPIIRWINSGLERSGCCSFLVEMLRNPYRF